MRKRGGDGACAVTAPEAMQIERLGKAASVLVWSAFILVALLIGGLLRIHLAQPGLAGAVLYPEERRSLPDFSLTDYNQTAFNKERLYGKWSFLFFGYTRCPDVCPHTLMTLRGAADLIRRDHGHDDVRFVFLSVDPERDGHARLKDYVAWFDPGFLGVTGSGPQLAALAEAMDAPYRKGGVESAAAGQYWMDHSAMIFLINPRAELYALLPPPHRAEMIAGDFQRLRAHYARQLAKLPRFPAFNLAEARQ